MKAFPLDFSFPYTKKDARAMQASFCPRNDPQYLSEFTIDFPDCLYSKKKHVCNNTYNTEYSSHLKL